MKKLWLISVAASCLAFVTGVAVGAGSMPFATSLNSGLVKAFDSVGKNLLGDEAFGASQVGIVPPDDGLQIDLVTPLGVNPPDDGAPVAKIINVVVPPEPVRPACEIGLQIRVSSDGAVSGSIDTTLLQNFRLEPISPIEGNPFCGAPPDDT